MTDFIKKYIDVNNLEGILLYCLIMLFISWFFSLIFRQLLILFLNRSKKKGIRNLTSLNFTKNSIRFIFFIIAFILIIGTVPFLRKQALLIFSGAGIIAAIIGFAAQAAIANLIAGVFIVMFKPFRIGDYIKLDKERVGIVTDITLRHTVINTFENKRLIIPNSIISTESILNHTIEESKVLSFNNLKVGLNADIDLVRKIILEEAEKLEFSTVDEKNVAEVRVIDIHESYIHIRAYIWISEPFQEFKMKCKFKERVHKRFLHENIEMPIPKRRIIS